MKKIFLSAAIACVCFLAAAQNTENDWANFGFYAQANKTAPRGAKAVFMGNSITNGWVKASPAFFSDNNYIGRGIGGQVTAQMLARFRPDVLELKPECVVILAGTNDIALNQGFISIPNIAGNIKSMAELARANGIKVIICSVLPAYNYRWRPQVENAPELITQLNTLLEEYARTEGFTYVDYHSPMKDERGGLPEKYARDGVHPTPEGYALMESIIKPVIDRKH